MLIVLYLTEPQVHWCIIIYGYGSHLLLLVVQVFYFNVTLYDT